jgi:hypothetical protein
VALLSPPFGAPPCPRGLLRLPIVEDGYPFSVLQIVRGADPVLDIPTSLVTQSREPRASPGPPSVAERKSLFEAAPIGLGPDWEAQPGRPGIELRFASRTVRAIFRHSEFGEFLGSIRGRMTVYHGGRKRQ